MQLFKLRQISVAGMVTLGLAASTLLFSNNTNAEICPRTVPVGTNGGSCTGLRGEGGAPFVWVEIWTGEGDKRPVCHYLGNYHSCHMDSEFSAGGGKWKSYSTGRGCSCDSFDRPEDCPLTPSSGGKRCP